MEPLRGGNLANAVPPAVHQLYSKASVSRSAAEWALRWVWNNPNVAIALSGMGTQAQVDENVRIAADAAAGQLTWEELALVDRVEVAYRTLVKVGCTACRYCMPCPQGVDIPRNFSAYNEFHMFLQSPAVKAGYQFVPAAERADRCVSCGACVDLCPQQIDIPAVMGQVAKTFA
jgi:predicted aldo/keto reductase-like oxidoreductase